MTLSPRLCLSLMLTESWRRAFVQDRDPATLLPVLAQSLQEQGVLPHHAVFVPPDSSYTSLARSKPRSVDVSWQQQQRDAWEAQLAALGALQVRIAANRSHVAPRTMLRVQASFSSDAHLRCTSAKHWHDLARCTP